VSAGRFSLFFVLITMFSMLVDPLKRIEEMALPLVEQADMFLVDLEIKQQEMNVVWIYVDSEKGGVNLDECSRISRELSFMIETEELFNSSYRLNVSSPGLSRPLSDKRQYAKNLGRSAKVKFKSAENYEKLEGVLKDVSDDRVTIRTDKGEETSIRFEDLVETKIVPKI